MQILWPVDLQKSNLREGFCFRCSGMRHISVPPPDRPHDVTLREMRFSMPARLCRMLLVFFAALPLGVCLHSTFADDPPIGVSKPEQANRSPAEKRKLTSADELQAKSTLLSNGGKFREAADLLKEVVELRREVLGDNHALVAQTLEQIGFLFNRQNRPADAQSYFEEALEIHKTAGDKTNEVARAYNYLGLALAAQRKSVEAKAAYDQAMAIVRPRANGKNADVAVILMNLSALYRGEGNYEKAAQYCEEALALRKAIFGEQHAATAESQATLGGIKYNQAKYGESVALHQQVLLTRQKLVGTNHRDTFLALINLAQALRENSQLVEAKTRFDEALQVALALYGEKHVETSTAYLNLGTALHRQSHFKEALPHLEKAVSIRKELFGEKSLAVADAEYYLGLVFRDMGQRNEARELFERARQVRKTVQGENTLVYGSLLAVLGDVAPDQPTARQYYQQALDLNEKIVGRRTLETARLLNSLGRTYHNLGEFSVAHSYYLRSYEQRKELVGERHPLLAYSLQDLSSVLNAQGKYAEAGKFARQALTLRQDSLGPRHLLTAESLSLVGQAEMDAARYDAAKPLFTQALSIQQELNGEKSAQAAMVLSSLGRLAQRQGDYRTARKLYDEVLAIRKQLAADQETPLVAETLGDLGSLLSAEGHYSEAQSHFERQLAIYTKHYGEKSRFVAGALQNLLGAQRQLGNNSEARKNAERALAINNELLGEKHPTSIRSLHELALVHQNLGDPKTAENMYRQVLANRLEVYGEKNPNTSSVLSALGHVLFNQSDYRGARSHFERALAIEIELFGEDSLNAANCYASMAVLEQGLGDFESAEKHLRRCLTIRQRVLGEEHPLIGRCYADLGALGKAQENHEMAKENYQNALENYTRAYGEQHHFTAITLNGRADAMHNLGDVEQAEKDHQRALAILKKALGDKHSSVGLTLGRLGVLHAAIGQETAATAELQEAVAIFRSAYPPSHPSIAAILAAQSALQARLNQLPDAVKTEDEGRRIVRAHVARTLPGLSDKEQLQFLEHKDRQNLHRALNMGVLSGADPALAATTAAWSLNAKAIAQESLAQSTLVARDMRNKNVASGVKQLLDVRRELASLTLRTPDSAHQKEYKQRLQELAAQEESLARRLSESGASAATAQSWVEVAELRRALPADGVLVEISRFQKYDFQAKSRKDRWQTEERYAAWIIPASADLPVRVVDFGSATKIDEAIAQVRNSLRAAIGTAEAPGTVQSVGEVEAEKAHLADLSALAKLVLRPLEPHLVGCKKLVLSPDAALWLAPWNALPSEDGEYLIEKLQIEYAISGRDVIAKAGERVSRRRPVVFANPNFDERVKVEAESEEELKDTFRSFASSTALPRVAQLPGTEVEARIIRPNLEKFTEDEALLFTEGQALESAFKALRQPRVLVLSTHGFFLDDQRKEINSESTSDEGGGALLNAEGKVFENPLLRCGLLLAGCNQRDAASGSDDGILTGMEILGADLRGTELVVLSACETGIGKIRNGEGVAGLRQAFQLAGAHAVVSTLWEIPDRETAKIMNEFFANLAANQTKAEALRNAQLSLIKARRTRNGAAHPLFWAAFSLTGK